MLCKESTCECILCFQSHMITLSNRFLMHFCGRSDGHAHIHVHAHTNVWCMVVLMWPLRKTCQSARPCLGLIIWLQKSFEPPPIRGWTAVCGQRPVCLCGRTPANLAVESGWLPDFSGFLTASSVRLSAAPSCWTCVSASFSCLPVVLTPKPPDTGLFSCLLNLLNKRA